MIKILPNVLQLSHQMKYFATAFFPIQSIQFIFYKNNNAIKKRQCLPSRFTGLGNI